MAGEPNPLAGMVKAGEVIVAAMIRHFANAIRLRPPPRCGARGILASWFRLRDHCPVCALDLDRNESGYQVGSYLVAIVAIFGSFGALLLVVLIATWPDPPWVALQWGGIAMMLVAPVLVYPFTKTLYLALDLTLRPDHDL